MIRTFERHTVETITIDTDDYPPERTHVLDLPWGDAVFTQWYEFTDPEGRRIKVTKDEDGNWMGREVEA